MRAASQSVRAVGLVGPAGAGKTTLLEALLFASGALGRRGDVALGTSVGDSSPESRRRGQSTEINLAGFDFLGDRFAIVDCPGSADFGAAADPALAAVDLAVVVVDPQPERAVLAQPALQALERLGVPRAVFVNKIDQARGQLDALTSALQGISATPMVARQLPLIEDGRVAGFVDLALERAFVYRAGEPSRQIDIPPETRADESQARFHMLEQLSEFDDALLEQLLTDVSPARDDVFADLVADVQQAKITPIFFGSAHEGFGVRRLLKALRHEAPEWPGAARRLGLDGGCAYVLGVSHAAQMGKLAYARLLGPELREGVELTLPNRTRARASMFSMEAGALRKAAASLPGEVVAFAKIDDATTGQLLSADGQARVAPAQARACPLYALAIEARDRKDDVRLSAALTKLTEEDSSLTLRRDPATQETVLEGFGEAHLQITLDRLRRRYGLEVVTRFPATGYRESIRKGVVQRGRHKKQTGGHGQFGDVVVEIKPAARGSGFLFSQRISGGAVPKQWIPAVEQGLKDALERGPMGFPVIDLEAVLTDGSSHSVDSSEAAFRAAGRLAMTEGLRACEPYLLEPIDRLLISAPSPSTPRITAAMSARRGQILGFEPKPLWPGWDEIRAYMPEGERRDFILELRGLTQGLGVFETAFDHMAELGGRLAEEVVKRQKQVA
ncbi:MAG: elongation factor [Caulobacteraceae bacterium]|nr:elongation factor [Caulobacteraceae bacterium]